MECITTEANLRWTNTLVSCKSTKGNWGKWTSYHKILCEAVYSSRKITWFYLSSITPLFLIWTNNHTVAQNNWPSIEIAATKKIQFRMLSSSLPRLYQITTSIKQNQFQYHCTWRGGGKVRIPDLREYAVVGDPRRECGRVATPSRAAAAELSAPAGAGPMDTSDIHSYHVE